MTDLDDVLSRDIDGKLIWVVSEITDIKNDISIIKDNHLTHIEKDVATMKKIITGVVAFLVSAFTGIQVM
jgi:hypothetical protein|tara:strand:- start:19 stop:228 length:210 start_codon:yes stop_codon:yes gene_type:complete